MSAEWDFSHNRWLENTSKTLYAIIPDQGTVLHTYSAPTLGHSCSKGWFQFFPRDLPMLQLQWSEMCSILFATESCARCPPVGAEPETVCMTISSCCKWLHKRLGLAKAGNRSGILDVLPGKRAWWRRQCPTKRDPSVHLGHWRKRTVGDWHPELSTPVLQLSPRLRQPLRCLT